MRTFTLSLFALLISTNLSPLRAGGVDDHSTAQPQVTAIVEQISAFDVWGWLDLFGGLIVVIGCFGELWLLLNKIPEHNERRAELKLFWSFLNRLESFLRTFCVQLKIIRSRKFSELKEHLLEGFFISLVALGVGLELLSLPFSLLESAKINEMSKQAERDAGNANLQAVALSNETVRLSSNLEESKSNNLALAKELFGLAAKTETMSGNIAEVRNLVSDPQIVQKLNEANSALVGANRLINSNLANLQIAIPDRTITPEQETNLVRLLKPVFESSPIKAEVQVLESDREALGYAKQMAELLQKVGISTDMQRLAFASFGSEYERQSGVFIIAIDFTNPPPHTVELANAFMQVGITNLHLLQYPESPRIYTNILRIRINQQFNEK
jgi:hypothetical protein